MTKRLAEWEYYATLKTSPGVKFRFHDLRHFAVSQLIAQGANILQFHGSPGTPTPASPSGSTPTSSPTGLPKPPSPTTQ